MISPVGTSWIFSSIMMVWVCFSQAILLFTVSLSVLWPSFTSGVLQNVLERVRTEPRGFWCAQESSEGQCEKKQQMWIFQLEVNANDRLSAVVLPASVGELMRASSAQQEICRDVRASSQSQPHYNWCSFFAALLWTARLLLPGFPPSSSILSSTFSG